MFKRRSSLNVYYMNQNLASKGTYLLGHHADNNINQGMIRLVATECISIYLIGKLNRVMFEIYVI
jgi:hypothetical protein